jgi:hypothetical protein
MKIKNITSQNKYFGLGRRGIQLDAGATGSVPHDQKALELVFNLVAKNRVEVIFEGDTIVEKLIAQASGEPEVTEPEVTEPEVTEPEVKKPEVKKPEVTEPEVKKPEVTEPEVKKRPVKKQSQK